MLCKKSRGTDDFTYRNLWDSSIDRSSNFNWFDLFEITNRNNLRFFHTTSSGTRTLHIYVYIWFTHVPAQAYIHLKWWNSMKFLDRSHFPPSSLFALSSSNVSHSHHTFPRSWLIWIRVNQLVARYQELLYEISLERGSSLMPRNAMLQINNRDSAKSRFLYTYNKEEKRDHRRACHPHRRQTGITFL